MPSFFYHIGLDFHPPTTPDAADERILASRPEVSQTSVVLTADSTHSAREPFRTTIDPLGARSRLKSRDWRYDRIKIQNIKMVSTATRSKRSSRGDLPSQATDGIVAGHGGVATKGRFEPINNEENDIGWGVVRLYRDAEETPGLNDEATISNYKGARNPAKIGGAEKPGFRDEDCTTLCILAVPSYLTPSDFLGFVGERTRDEVSHFRMIRTERGNRYMVLMKFRNGKKAREWRREWNGKAFDSMEVRASGYLHGEQMLMSLCSLRTAMLSSSNLSNFKYQMPGLRSPFPT